jgi:hypothetical protein
MQNAGKTKARLIISTGLLLILMSGCGASPKPSSSNGFGRAPSGQGNGIVRVTLDPPNVSGGAAASITVTSAQPAPAGGLAVILSNSDSSVVATPANLVIAAGHTTATMAASTSVVDAATSVTISASSNGSTAEANLSVVPNAPASASFSVAVQPATVTVQQGHSGSSNVVTKVAGAYNHALQLKASGQPSGVSASLKPPMILAPGAGSSQLGLTVQSSAEVGSYPISVTAGDGKNFRTAKLTLNVTGGSSNPNATFKGCWYTKSGHSYQGVDISVGNPGTYPFNALLYNGTTCDPNSIADQIGFGNPLTFGGFGYTFWFTDFADQTDMSALWTVGDDSSQCVNYAVAPSC